MSIYILFISYEPLDQNLTQFEWQTFDFKIFSCQSKIQIDFNAWNFFISHQPQIWNFFFMNLKSVLVSSS